jgi:hypothetical protein
VVSVLCCFMTVQVKGFPSCLLKMVTIHFHQHEYSAVWYLHKDSHCAFNRMSGMSSVQ